MRNLVLERNQRWEEPREQIQANAIAEWNQRIFDARRALNEAARPAERRPRRLLKTGLLFVCSYVDLIASVDPRISGVIHAAVNRRATATVSNAASQACASRIDRRRARLQVQIRRISQTVEQRIRHRRTAVFPGARLIRGERLVTGLAGPINRRSRHVARC